MTRRHSLVTRALALVMALMLIASNGAGLTLGAKAAEDGKTLYGMMSELGASNAELDKVLEYAGTFNVLDNTNFEISYEDGPTELTKEQAVLNPGVLTAYAYGDWVPTYYYVGDSETREPFGKAVDGTWTATVDDDVVSAYIVYTLDLGVADEVKAVQNAVNTLANVASVHKSCLDKLAENQTYLSVLSTTFLVEMETAVMNLTADQLGVSTDPKEYMTDEQKETYDSLPAELQKQIDDEVKEKIDAEILEVKEEYVNLIYNTLLPRMVSADSSDPYYTNYYNSRLGTHTYLNKLRVYAMVAEYNMQKTGGLAHYYQNDDRINSELTAMAGALNQLLGMKVENGTVVYENKAIVDSLLIEMDYAKDGINADLLIEMSNKFSNTASQLTDKTVKNALRMDSPNLKAACDALGDYSKSVKPTVSALVLETGKLPVQNDLYRSIYYTIGSEKYDITCLFSNEELTEAEINDIYTQIAEKAAEKHYTVDEAKIKEQLKGLVMNQNHDIDSYSERITYYVTVTNECGEDFKIAIVVDGDNASVTLPVGDGEIRTYYVNGEKKVSEEATAIVITDTLDNLRALTVVLDDIDNKYEDRLVDLVNELNKQIGDGAFVLTANAEGTYVGLTANITMADIGTFGKILITKDFTDVALYEEDNFFLYVNENKKQLMSVNALITALLNDDSFDSQKLIDLGTNGQGNLLNTTMYLPGYELAFELNLTAVPAQMGTVANGLNAIKDIMTFAAGDGRMNVQLTIPEKVYEAYVTAAVLSGNMSDNDVADLNNKVTMEFMADYFELLKNSEANTETYTNTLKLMGVDKDLTGYEDYYQLLKSLFNHSEYTIDEKLISVTVSGDNYSLDSMLAVFGMSMSELTMGMDVIAEEDITVETHINLTNDAPKFQALVIDPVRVKDEGYKAKIMAANYTQDLTAVELKGPAAIMLLGDVTGNLTFEHTTILDLNGFTVNGSITANAPLYIVDSTLDTVSGGGVTGSVTGDVTILSGTYPAANVESFLKDGYYVDGSSVVNAMYQIAGGKIVVDGNLYLDYVDGYLPAAHYMAADLAIDLVLNYYFAAGLSAEGETIYAISFTDLVAMLENKDIGDAADQVLACIDAAGISNLINSVIADLLDFASIQNAIDNNTSLASYTFTTYPWTVAVRHEDNGDYVTMDVLPSSEGKSITLDLTLKIPEGSKKDKLVKAIGVLANRVVADETEITVTIDQPVRDGKNLVVGGSGSATITLDFSNDDQYNRLLAGVLAYFNDELTDELVDNGCIIELNQKMSVVTVGDFFTAVKGVIENKELDFAAIAAKLEIELTDAELAKLEELYDDFQIVCTKIIDKFELTTNATAPLSELADGNGEFTVNGDIQPHTADIYRRGFGLIANLGYTDATLVVRLAPKCTQILGDANGDGKVNTADSYLIACYSVGDPTADPHLCVSDVNGDGKYNTADSYEIAMRSVDPNFVFTCEKK